MIFRHAFVWWSPRASQPGFGFVPVAPLHVARQPVARADAFILGSSARPAARVSPGETVTIEVPGGEVGRDWSATRMSPAPAVTGPILVEDAEAGDMLVVSVASIDPLAPTYAGSCLAVAIAIAGDNPRHARAGTTACLAVRQPGAPVTFGPVRPGADGAPVAALVVATISVWSGERDERP